MIVLKHDPATLPERMKDLPIDERGFVVPWFVDWIDGKPEFRAADAGKWIQATEQRLCWVCGQKMGRYLAFLIGPMCGINRTTAEPPSHLECAEWSAKNCPFISRPKMARRAFTEEFTERLGQPVVAGFSIDRNPGVMLVWVTTTYEIWRDKKGMPLIQIGDPDTLLWYSEGRTATREEIDESIRTGLPYLEQEASRQVGGMEYLRTDIERFTRMLPES